MTTFEDVLKRVAKVKAETDCETTKRILDDLFPDVEADVEFTSERRLRGELYGDFHEHFRTSSPDIIWISPELARATGLNEVFWEWTGEDSLHGSPPEGVAPGWFGYHVTVDGLQTYVSKIWDWYKKGR